MEKDNGCIRNEAREALRGTGQLSLCPSCPAAPRSSDGEGLFQQVAAMRREAAPPPWQIWSLWLMNYGTGLSVTW